ncbi:hypothetical protein EPK97_21295 [Chengkuizengella sediminis]|nr:hypothetical protein [Chengkuizengella sediminis]
MRKTIAILSIYLLLFPTVVIANEIQVTNFPLTHEDVKKSLIGAGTYHTVGLKSNGSVMAVGRDNYGQVSGVLSWTDIIEVSAGGYHTVGLKSDGSVVAVGIDSDGQTNVSDWTDIVQVGAGHNHTVGLKSDGSVVAVGRNGYGETNVSDWTDIIQVSANHNRTAGLKSDGSVVHVGEGQAHSENVSDWTDIVQVSAAGQHTVGLKSDGSVVAVGSDYYGQISGLSDWTDIVQVSAGPRYTLGLKSDGSVVAIGEIDQATVLSWENIVQVSAGTFFHSVALKGDGSMVGVGSDSFGQISGVSDWTDIAVPIPNQPVHVIASSDDSQISISWNKVFGSESYIIKRSTSPGGPYDIVGETSSTSFIDINPMDGTRYYYVICAVNGVGVEGDPSNEVSSQLNSAPISISPGYVDSEQIVRGSFIDLNWETLRHQSAFQVQIMNELDEIMYDSDWIQTENVSYTVPEGVLQRNQVYSWKVRIQDEFGVISPYSDVKYIKLNNLPTLSITSHIDGQQALENSQIFTWNYSDENSQIQTTYEVLGSQDNWETWSYNSGVITSSVTTHTTPMLAGGEWDFAIRVFDGMEWSELIHLNNLQIPGTYEPNEDFNSAFPIIYQSSYSTTINSDVDVDFYKYIPQKTGIDYVSLIVPQNTNYDVYIYDADMNYMTAGNEEVYYFVESNQTYYIKIISTDGSFSEEAYSFTVSPLQINIQTQYQYDENGNLVNKQTTIEN